MKKRYAFLLGLFFYCNGNLIAQTPSWQWTWQVGGPIADVGYSIVTDAQGNIIVGGHFTGTIIAANMIYTAQGISDFFIAKLDPLGNPIWFQTGSSQSADYIFSLDVDPFGGIVACGQLDDGISAPGNLVVAGVPLPNARNGSFVMKLDSSGNLEWCEWPTIGTILDNNQAVATDHQGNIYVAGESHAPGNFLWDGQTLSNSDIYLAKLDPAGNVLWLRGPEQAVTPGNSSANAVAVDALGNVFWGGQHSEEMVLGNDTLAGDGSVSTDEIFLAKLDSLGNYLWVNNLVGPGDDNLWDLTVDDQGDCYFTGNYFSTLVVGSDTLTASSAGGDFILGKVSGNGNFRWARTSDSGSNKIGLTVDMGPGGDVWMGGSFRGSSTIGNFSLTNAGNADILLARYDSTGQIQEVGFTGGILQDRINELTVDNAGNLYATGTFSETCIFGADTLTAIGSVDMFAAKYGFPIPQPTQAASNLQITNVTCSSMELSWTNGDGDRRLVVGRAGSPVNQQPQDGTGYTPNANWATGDDLGGGNYVLYDGTGNSVALTGLPSGTTFHFEIFEFNSSGSGADYLLSPSLAGSQATLSLVAAQINPPGPSEVCDGDSLQLQGPSGAVGYQWLGNGTAISGATTPDLTVGTSGNFALVTTTLGGCQDTSIANLVSFNPSPTAGFTAQTTGTQTQFANTSTGFPVSAVWDFGDGNSSTQSNPVHSYATSGTYLVCLTASTAQSCSDTFCDSVAVVIVSRAEPSPEGFSIYPNPSPHQFYLNPNQGPTGPLDLEVWDGLGRRILTQTVPAGQQWPVVVPLHSAVSGVYLLKVTTEAGVWYEKLVRE